MISGIGSSFGPQDLEALRQNRFKKADQDGDGKITQDEMKAVVPQNGKGPGVEEFFSQVDTNQDGAIDETEDQAAFEQIRQKGPGPGGPPDAAKMAAEFFKKADASGDGKITKDELTEALGENDQGLNVDDLFKAADADEDGTITESELEDSLKQILEELQTQSPPPPPRSPSSIYDGSGSASEEAVSRLFSAVA